MNNKRYSNQDTVQAPFLHHIFLSGALQMQLAEHEECGVTIKEKLLVRVLQSWPCLLSLICELVTYT